MSILFYLGLYVFFVYLSKSFHKISRKLVETGINAKGFFVRGDRNEGLKIEINNYLLGDYIFLHYLPPLSLIYCFHIFYKAIKTDRFLNYLIDINLVKHYSEDIADFIHMIADELSEDRELLDLIDENKKEFNKREKLKNKFYNHSIITICFSDGSFTVAKSSGGLEVIETDGYLSSKRECLLDLFNNIYNINYVLSEYADKELAISKIDGDFVNVSLEYSSEDLFELLDDKINEFDIVNKVSCGEYKFTKEFEKKK